MPNPLFLQVMGVTIHEYNSYSIAKKARFQKAAAAKLAEVHETDMDSYVALTEATAKTQNQSALNAEHDADMDKEFE